MLPPYSFFYIGKITNFARFKSQNVFFNLLATCIGKPLALAANSKPTFFQDPQRGYIVFGSTAIERTNWYMIQTKPISVRA